MNNVERTMYKSALDRLRMTEDAYGRVIWIEKTGHDGKPVVYYKYNSKGRLMKHTRKIFGYDVTPAEYSRFGEDTQIEVVKQKPAYGELR